MGLETQTEVEQINTVQDGDGNRVPPATEDKQRAIADAVGNEDGLVAEEVMTDGTAPEALPQHDVPEGITVLVTYLSSNGSDVWVGDDTAQPIPLTQTGDTATFNVTDTSSIYIRTQTAGDGVGLVFEGGA